MLKAGIHTWLTFMPTGYSTILPCGNSISKGILMHLYHFFLFTYICLTATKCSIHSKSFALRKWQLVILSHECSTPWEEEEHIYCNPDSFIVSQLFSVGTHTHTHTEYNSTFYAWKKSQQN